MTKILNVSIKRGDTQRHFFTLKAGKAPIDISSWTTFVLTVNTEKAPANTDNQVGSIAGQFVTDGTDGRISFTPPGTWAVGDYFYDAQAIDANGEKITFVEGSYKVQQDITKV